MNAPSSLFCRNPELIENYGEAISDTTQTWHCHHRLETHNSDGERRLIDITKEELVALDMYYDRPPEELIFLTHFEHRSLHNKGKYVSNETRTKISKYKSKNPSKSMLGKRHSDETKQKISVANKGKHPSEEARKKMSDARKGENNGMYGKHHSEETKKKLSEARKGKKMSDEFRKKRSEYMKGKHWKLVDGKRVYY